MRLKDGSMNRWTDESIDEWMDGRRSTMTTVLHLSHDHLFHSRVPSFCRTYEIAHELDLTTTQHEATQEFEQQEPRIIPTIMIKMCLGVMTKIVSSGMVRHEW